MNLPGKLAATTLGDLLGRLYRGSATGTLELRRVRTARRDRIHISRGLVVAVDLDFDLETATSARFGELAAGAGLVPAHVVEGQLARQQSREASCEDEPVPCGEWLVRAGVLTGDMRDAVLRAQARTRLEALFRCLDRKTADEVEVRFHVGPTATRLRVGSLRPLDPHDFLHGRPRARARRPGFPEETPCSARTSPKQQGALPVETSRSRALRLFGLSPNATLVDPTHLRRTFRRLASALHPDRHFNADVGTRSYIETKFAELSAAYHFLCS